MSNIRHILRLYSQKQTMSEIIIQTGINRATLKKYIADFKENKLTFAEIDELNDKDLGELFTKPDERFCEKIQTLYSLFPTIEKELRQRGVTQWLLWQEYKVKYTDHASRGQFNFHFKEWKGRIQPAMRQEHKAGDKLYIDFAGVKLSLINKETGIAKPVEVFVAILGASQLTYVEAVMTQRKEDFIPACENALNYYGGSPAAIVPDNLRSAVTKSDKYEPTINETFADFAEHYNTTILPARAYKPKDKALVEGVIKIIYTRIYAKMRNLKFYYLEELNKAIRIFLEEHNNEILTGKACSRRQQFEEHEKVALVSLPMLRYEFKKQCFVTVLKYGYISLAQDKHFYSVPYIYIGKRVKVMYTRYNVEIYYEYERIALHKRSNKPYKYTMDKEHLPPSHRFVVELEPDRLLTKAEEIHKDVQFYISKILNRTKEHKEQRMRACQGILDFSNKVGNERLIKACQLALDCGIHNYIIIKKILREGLEGNSDKIITRQPNMPQHENIRGGDYYN
jgi:transposase